MVDARATSRAAANEMLSRCSAASRTARFLGPSRTWPDNYVLGALSGAPGHDAFAAVTGSQLTVGLASVVSAGVHAEFAVLVEDVWQGSGIGTALTAASFERALTAGVRVIECAVHAANETAVRVVLRAASRFGLAVDHTHRNGVVTFALTAPRASGPEFGPVRCATRGS